MQGIRWPALKNITILGPWDHEGHWSTPVVPQGHGGGYILTVCVQWYVGGNLPIVACPTHRLKKLTSLTLDVTQHAFRPNET